MKGTFIIIRFRPEGQIVSILHSNGRFYGAFIDMRGCHTVLYRTKGSACKAALKHAWVPGRKVAVMDISGITGIDDIRRKLREEPGKYIIDHEQQ